MPDSVFKHWNQFYCEVVVVPLFMLCCNVWLLKCVLNAASVVVVPRLDLRSELWQFQFQASVVKISLR